MPKPRLTFFSELAPEPLKNLFSAPDLLDLPAMGARVSLGILDFSPERAEVVRRLNEAGVPVVAWLLLPQEQGYWFNIDNASQAADRYQAFKSWTEENALVWAGVGLDIEPDIRLFRQLAQNKLAVVWTLVKQVFKRRRLKVARGIYSSLIWQIESDGYPVETYIFPFVLDERKVRSTLLQRATGLIDLPSDREVLMLYSSFYRPNGPGFLWSYAPDARAVGLGSTGGGVELDGFDFQTLSWEELSRDLRLAWVYTNDIYIFSLEGCVERGFLPRLKSFEWDQPVVDPVAMGAQVDAWRHTVQTGLWVNKILLPVALSTGGALFLISRILKNRKKKKAALSQACPPVVT